MFSKKNETPPANESKNDSEEITIEVALRNIREAREYDCDRLEAIRSQFSDLLPCLAPESYYEVSSLEAGIDAHHERILTLEKMKRNEPVTQREFDHLMKMQILKQSSLAKYQHIVQALPLQNR